MKREEYLKLRDEAAPTKDHSYYNNNEGHFAFKSGADFTYDLMMKEVERQAELYKLVIYSNETKQKLLDKLEIDGCAMIDSCIELKEMHRAKLKAQAEQLKIAVDALEFVITHRNADMVILLDKVQDALEKIRSNDG